MTHTQRLPVSAWICGLLALVLFAGLTFMPGTTLITDGLIAVAAALATAFTWLCTRQFDKTERPRHIWFHFTLGLGLWTLGEILWLIYSIFTEAIPTPSLGDGAWLSGYIFLTIALLAQYRLIWGAHPRQERRALLFGGVGVLAGAALIASRASSQDRVMIFINAFYPLADLAIALAALWLAHAFGSGQWGRPWQALWLFALADAVYAWLTGTGLYQAGGLPASLADTLYFGAYVVLVLASYSQYRLVKRA